MSGAVSSTEWKRNMKSEKGMLSVLSPHNFSSVSLKVAQYRRRSFQQRLGGRGRGHSLNDSSSWNQDMIRNLSYLIDKLSKTIRAWGEFQGHDIHYFFSDAYAGDECLGSDGASSVYLSDCLKKIERTFYHLSGHLDSLDALKKRMIESDCQTVS